MRKILMIGLISLALMLVGCESMTMQLEADGSGKAIIEIANEEGITLEGVKEDLEGRLGDEEGFSNLSVRETDEQFQVGFEFENINYLDPNAYHLPVADYVVSDDDRLTSLAMVDDQEEFTEKSTGIFVSLPLDLENTKVIFPGDVVAHSEEVEVVDKNVVEVDTYGRGYIVFEPKANMSKVSWLIIATPIVGGGVLYYTRKRRNNRDRQQVKEEGEALA